jgi:hypothetical protein
MSETTLARQYIRDVGGNPVGVILSLEEFEQFQTLVEQRELEVAAKVSQMKDAATDPAFLADLEDTMAAFGAADAEWWEPT